MSSTFSKKTLSSSLTSKNGLSSNKKYLEHLKPQNPTRKKKQSNPLKLSKERSSRMKQTKIWSTCVRPSTSSSLPQSSLSKPVTNSWNSKFEKTKESKSAKWSKSAVKKKRTTNASLQCLHPGSYCLTLYTGHSTSKASMKPTSTYIISRQIKLETVQNSMHIYFIRTLLGGR